MKCLLTSARSNKKLVVLHGAVAADIKDRLGDTFAVHSLGINKKKKMPGRYIEKSVDITVEHQNEPVAGFAVKLAMGNYSQNSNNYFENMLGETTNIRCAGSAYFQIFIIPKYVPYYNRSGAIVKWEEMSIHDLEKYVILSSDDPGKFMHTPNKMLMAVVEYGDIEFGKITTQREFINYFENNPPKFKFAENKASFDNTIIYNDYEIFADKAAHYIKSL